MTDTINLVSIVDHECYIGLYYDTEYDALITLSNLKSKVYDDKDLKKIADLDPMYASIYHNRMKHYELSDYLDKRKNVNMWRFEFCPMCGKKIDWKKMRGEVLADSDR